MSAAAAVRLIGAATPGELLIGTVERFDDAAGLGTVDLGGVGSVPFHCTAIADGTRTIAEGTRVACRLATAHLGGVEAVGVVAAG